MVGVDIGCGMLAVKTSMKRITTEQLKKIVGGTNTYRGGIRSVIPLGFSHHKNRQEHEIFDDTKAWNETTIALSEYESAQKQVGTLGGGNHFIEIQLGSDGHIWFMIHSGSRNLGYKVAEHYNKLAREIYKDNPELLSTKLPYLPAGSNEFNSYISEMTLCLRFAYANRQVMADFIKEEFRKNSKKVEFLEEINIHHNYANLEEHFGEKVWVHRKGATLATKETIGIIPGSQGTPSYIVKGLGNENSLSSCSHGAGRKMSRKKAIEKLDLNFERNRLEKQKIIHALFGKSSLDEAPSAYKDIDAVMKQQGDLVETLVKLKPLAVVKG
jgi:tRNA-splicing ligase RtcB